MVGNLKKILNDIGDNLLKLAVVSHMLRDICNWTCSRSLCQLRKYVLDVHTMHFGMPRISVFSIFIFMCISKFNVRGVPKLYCMSQRFTLLFTFWIVFSRLISKLFWSFKFETENCPHRLFNNFISTFSQYPMCAVLVLHSVDFLFYMSN